MSSNSPFPNISLRGQPAPMLDQTLVSLFMRRLHENPDRVLYSFTETDAKNLTSLTYQELYDRASKIAAFLTAENTARSPVLLLFNCNLDYLVAFWGCLLAGQIAVPVYPPTATKHFERLASVIASAGSTYGLVSREIHTIMSLADADHTRSLALKLVEVETILDRPSPRPASPIIVDSESVAFLQYTSGSTGQPKGVMLSHRALLADLMLIHRNCHYTEDDIIVMWLPLYHDMGLIAGALSALYSNAQLVFTPPQTIVRPYRWLKLISDVRGTVTGGPNFSLDMCINRISEKEVSTLDLSSIRFIAAGAEPVRSRTVRGFYQKFAAARLRANVITPCYGLAEACVFALTSPLDSPTEIIQIDAEELQKNSGRIHASPTSEKVLEYVSCGVISPATGARIVNPDALPDTLSEVDAFTVGELILSGRHLMSGYWNSPEATNAALISIDGTTYLRTGDLAFRDDRCNLYFCGRVKDMIILRGKNYYATDLEISAAASSGELAGCINSAFSFDADAVEKTALIQELPLDFKINQLSEIREKIQEKLAADHGILFDDIAFVPRGSIKRTSAGKVRRLATKELYLRGALKRYERFSEAEIRRLRTRALLKKIPVKRVALSVHLSIRRSARSLRTRLHAPRVFSKVTLQAK